MIMGKGSPRFQQYMANLNRVRMNEFVDNIQRAQYGCSGAGFSISGVSFAERRWPVPARGADAAADVAPEIGTPARRRAAG